MKSGVTVDSDVLKRADLVCQTLRQQVTGTVTTPQDESYEAEQERLWSGTCWLPAAAYVRPQSTAQVAAVLATLKKTNTKFAVRSTGHHSTADFSSVDESGVVIDLRDLKSLALDEDGDGSFTLRAAVAAPGATCTLSSRNAVVPSSGLATLVSGLGGFTLGGTYGLPGFFFSSFKSFYMYLVKFN
ncbi:6-hydroxy-D-nicotine oxidase [Apiospora saccharicola]